jgi:hypothetical protein
MLVILKPINGFFTTSIMATLFHVKRPVFLIDTRF